MPLILESTETKIMTKEKDGNKDELDLDSDEEDEDEEVDMAHHNHDALDEQVSAIHCLGTFGLFCAG